MKKYSELSCRCVLLSVAMIHNFKSNTFTLHQVPANWTPGRQYLKLLTMIHGYFPKNQGWCFLKQLVYICVCVCVSECSVSIVHFRNSRLMTFKKHMVDITSLVPYVWKRRIKLSGANYMNSPTWVTQTHISSIYRNEQILPPHLSKKHPWGH